MQDTERIKDALDVVDIVGEHVQLKPAGAHFKGLCPFHREKSPSFMVSRERQSWHCFGCGKGGDIFSFVMEIDGMEFREALEHLARKAGITLSASAESQKHGRKDIKQVLIDSTKLFSHILLNMSQGKEALEYVKKRGMSESDIMLWGVGYAPQSWDVLLRYLLKRGHSIEDILNSGLVVKKDGGQGRYFDRFRDRVMFPIRSVQGDVVGFTGRLLHENPEAGGKYVNTPETELYNKSKIIFGLDKARAGIRESGYAVLVEGQMDVIASHKVGITQTVAVSGTALTAEQVKLIGRYTTEVRMAFDGDAAGISAAMRSIDVLLVGGLSVKIIRIPDGAGKDPDECIQKDPEIWRAAVLNAEEIMQWLMDTAFSKFDSSSARGKHQIGEMVLSRISKIPFSIEKDHWLRNLSHRLQVDVSVLREEMRRLQQKDGVKTQTVNVDKKPIVEYTEEVSAIDKHIALVIQLVFAFPNLKHPLELLPPLDSLPGHYASLAQKVKSVYTPDNNLFDLVKPLLSVEEYQLLDTLLHRGDFTRVDVSTTDAQADIRLAIKRISLLILQKSLSEARAAGDVARAQELLSKIHIFST